MLYQIGTDSESNPINVSLELENGNLIIRDNENNLMTRTIGNPSIPGDPDNQPFPDIDEAYQWFLTTKHSKNLDEDQDQ